MGEEERENKWTFQSFEGDAISIVVHIEGNSSVGLSYLPKITDIYIIEMGLEPR